MMMMKKKSDAEERRILYTQEPVIDYLQSAISKAIQIHMCEPPGDVLVFLTSKEEIEQACSRIVLTLGDQVRVMPLYSSLPRALKRKIFEPTPHSLRKIVVSTDVAEAPMSLDGIAYVVDPGFSMQKVYNTAVGSWLVSPISQASADQRAGRAGKKCFRLYTEETFNRFLRETPEIFIPELVDTVLDLKRQGVNDLTSVEFIDPPSPEMLLAALTDLFHLGAVDEDGNLI